LKTAIRYHRGFVSIDVPDNAIVYASRYPSPIKERTRAVIHALRKPIGSPSLSVMIKAKTPRTVIVVVSDITRPVPYKDILPPLLKEITGAGVKKENITLLIANGMHRPSTRAERVEMFGSRVTKEFRIIDHEAGRESDLVLLKGKSAYGANVKINRHFINADFRITTGLVEPHFMAGFSGGRKAICPGIASLETLRQFHGERFINSRYANNGVLKNNPLHREASSVAELAGVDFCVNAVMDSERRLVGLFAGALTASHEAAMKFAAKCACPVVRKPADIVITGSGGYPLDTTFYQCGKGYVGCLPAVKKNGVIIALGGCTEGVGSPEYEGTLIKYSCKMDRFLVDIKKPECFVKDQWQVQMQARALAKVGQKKLHFFTHGLTADRLKYLSVNGHADATGSQIGKAIQSLLAESFKAGMIVAVFPEGPYCAPVES
jgi:nickel-dependent lactate racemase